MNKNKCQKFKSYFDFFKTFKQSIQDAIATCSIIPKNYEEEYCPNDQVHESKLRELMENFVSQGIKLLFDESFTLPKQKIDQIFDFSFILYGLFIEGEYAYIQI